MTPSGDDAQRSDQGRRILTDPDQIGAQINDLLAGLGRIADDDENQLPDSDIDEIARRLSEAHDVLVRALESAEKG
jgi:hypothetical protein